MILAGAQARRGSTMTATVVSTFLSRTTSTSRLRATGSVLLQRASGIIVPPKCTSRCPPGFSITAVMERLKMSR